MQYKQHINRFKEQKDLQPDLKAKDFKAKLLKQDSMVSLVMIPQNMEQIEHKITERAFRDIQASNVFIWKKLNQLAPNAKPLQELDKNNQQNRTYFIVPLIYADIDQKELEIDYDSIKAICLGSLATLNGKQWINKIKPSALKYELVEYKSLTNSKKNQLYISYGIHKDRHKQIKEEQKEIIPDDDESDAESVATYVTYANSSVMNRFNAFNAAGKKKLNPRSPINAAKEVILTMREGESITVKGIFYFIL